MIVILQLGKKYLNSKLEDDVKEFPKYNLHRNDCKETDNKFYNEILKTWADLHFHEPESKQEVLKQMLWQNSNIKVNHEVISYRTWKKKKIYIQDILDDNGNIATKENIERKYGIKCRYFVYESLI